MTLRTPATTCAYSIPSLSFSLGGITDANAAQSDMDSDSEMMLCLPTASGGSDHEHDDNIQLGMLPSVYSEYSASFSNITKSPCSPDSIQSPVMSETEEIGCLSEGSSEFPYFLKSHTHDSPNSNDSTDNLSSVLHSESVDNKSKASPDLNKRPIKSQLHPLNDLDDRDPRGFGDTCVPCKKCRVHDADEALCSHPIPGGRTNHMTSESTSSTQQVSGSGRILKKVHRFSPLEESGVKCPSCGTRLNPRCADLHSHLMVELQRLRRYQKSVRKSSEDALKKAKPSTSKQSEVEPGEQDEAEDESEIKLSPEERYETYLKVKRKRLQRKQAKESGEGTPCPVCNQWITGSQDELTRHVEQCLGQASDHESEDVDVDGEDEQYEEYTWAGQTRIRATTMLTGGLAASGFKSGEKCEDDDDVDLDIEDDDTGKYGTPQFSEADLIPCTEDEPGDEEERQALRDAVLRSSGECSQSSTNTATDSLRWTLQPDNEKSDGKPPHTTDNISTKQAAKVISNLKTKLKEQEELLKKLDRHKCLICMEIYTEPLVSIRCWHVHCEECWFRTLGAKKLCPQCNMITSAVDLRKIYL